jgi:predicted lipoprotein with Yx(FWY)xxD motif
MKTTRTLMLAGGAAGALVLAACGSSSGGTSNAATNPQAGSSGSTVNLAMTNLGSVLTDSSGKTLYMLSSDTTKSTTCNGGCLGIWAPVAAPSSGTPSAGSGVTGTLGTFSRGSTKQVTISGHQLYTYAGDSGPGATTGQGINTYGGTWSALSASGSGVQASSGGSAPSPSGGYGY